MSDLRRLKRHLARIEPLAAIFRAEGSSESDAMFVAAALLHGQPVDRLMRIRDLVRSFPPLTQELLSVRLGVCTEQRFTELCKRTRAAQVLRDMTGEALQVRASYYTPAARGS